MKIGFLGNANNYPFMLARAIRRAGHDVVFIIDKQIKLDRPEFRYDDITLPYPDWIIDKSPFTFYNLAFPSRKKKDILRLLRTCDAVVLNGFWPTLLPSLDCGSAVLLTGSDLEFWGDRGTVDKLPTISRAPTRIRYWIRRKLYSKIINAFRTGVRKATVVNYFSRGLVPAGDRLLDEIGLTSQQRVFFMMSDLEKINFEPLRQHDTLRVFCATRFMWKGPIPHGFFELDFKGSDIMIKGLGLFWRKTRIPLDIRLVKKGPHVADSMELAKKEGLTNLITWLEEMSQMTVWEEFKNADIVFEQFGQSVVGMAGLDAMAMGRPVIANGRPEIFEPIVGEKSPICQAKTPEEVCQQLERLVSSKEERERVGIESRRYVERHFSSDSAAKVCLQHLTNSIHKA